MEWKGLASAFVRLLSGPALPLGSRNGGLGKVLHVGAVR